MSDKNEKDELMKQAKALLGRLGSTEDHKLDFSYIVIRRCIVRDGVFYAAAWGESVIDFYTGEDGEDEEKAFVAVNAEIKKRGLELEDVQIEHRQETLEGKLGE